MLVLPVFQTHLQKHEKELLEENLKTEKHIKDIEETHSKLKVCVSSFVWLTAGFLPLNFSSL